MGQQKTEAIQIGAVLSKRGKVTAMRSGDEMRILKRGDAIYSDDTVSTVRGATLQLRMKDRNIVMLRGGSSFRVNQYQMETPSAEVKRYDYAGGELRPSRKGL
ncbi:hypothetical protein [Thiolinea disciformis]|uniref:hypothetical protein n=1 Tax=Thiolinea disciformis TaxID=125614 RepID=UPI0003762767|nr:hypothetical protein [Thiolinea disciformis]